MIGVRITANAQKVLLSLTATQREANEELMKAVEWGARQVQSVAKQKYFLTQRGKGAAADPHTLTNRTGHLRGSINVTPINIVAKRNFYEVSAQVGTNKEYGAVHELGFSGAQHISSHFRRTPSGKVTSVRGFSRTVHIGKRPFLQPARDDVAGQYFQKVDEVIRRVWGKK